MAIHTYVCNDVDAQGYEGPGADGAFTPDDEEFTSGDYTAVSVDDANYIYDNTLTNYQYHRFDFTITENINTISQIDITWKGHGGRDVPLVPVYGHSLWVKENGTWTKKDSGTSGTKETLTSQKTNDFSEWISGGHLHVGSQSDWTGAEPFPSWLASYYVEVKITYTPVTVHIKGAKILGGSIATI